MNVFLCQLNAHLTMLWHLNNSTGPLISVLCDVSFASCVLYLLWSSKLELLSLLHCMWCNMLIVLLLKL